MKQMLGAVCAGALLMACSGLSTAPPVATAAPETDITALEQACLQAPLDAARWERLAAALEADGQRERAATMYQQASTLRTHDIRRDYALLKEHKAETPPEAADNADPDSADAAASDTNDERRLTQAWLLLAQIAEQRGDLKAAEAWLAKIDDPKSALDVQSRRGSLLARQGQMAQARELIRRVPERNDEEARNKVLAEVQLLREFKRWREATEVMAAANKRFPDDADLLYEQAMLEDKLDHHAEMERLLQRVIALKPDNPHAHNALGYSLADRSVRLPEAKSLIQKAMTLAPGDPFIVDSMGWVEFRMGNRDEALRWLRQAYAARPDTEIAAHLGEVLWAMGQRDEARRVWQDARGRDAANEVLKETLARLKVSL